MKKRILAIVVLVMLMAVPSFAAWTITSQKVSDYSDNLGYHAVIKITVTIDGSAGSFTTADISGSVRKFLKGYVYWFGIDGVDTGTAPQLTVTDPWNFTRFVYASFHATNPVTVAGNVYNGQYPQIFDGTTFTFTDSGDNGQVFYFYMDMVQ